jgi:electron transfer flavoprotein alpha subunit
MSAPLRQDDRHGEIIRAELGMSEDDVVTKVLEFRPETEHEAAQLPFADFVVSGGRGLGNADNLKLLWTLADALGAEVGATRPLVTSGWMPPERQVGQTGKTVRPKLYVAAGVSGAIQHRVGMENSDVILAINTDPKAPIFEFATHGVVADAVMLLPELAAAIEARLAVSATEQEQS